LTFPPLVKAQAQTPARRSWLESGPAVNRQSALSLVVALLLGAALARLSLPASIVILAGLAILLLIAVRPLFGLGVTLMLGPLGALENILWGNQLADSGQALLAITTAAWLARGMVRRRLGLRPMPLTIPLALFIGMAAFSVPDGSGIGLGLKELLKWVEIALVMFMVVSMGSEATLRYQRKRNIIVAMLLLAGSSQALVGIWQFGLRGDGPETFAVLGRFYRAYGTFEQPNPFGGFMNLTALLAWGTLAGNIIAAWNRRRQNGSPSHPTICWLRSSEAGAAVPWLMLLAGLSALLTTAALIFSWSRGAWLGFTAGAIVGLLFWPKKTWRSSLILLPAVVVGLLFLAGAGTDLLPESLVARISDLGQGIPIGDVRGADINDANYAELERLAHWQAALDMARDHLGLGIGFGAYEAAYPDYALINWPYALGHAHNYYLNLLAETGLLGLTAYIVLWICVIWQNARLIGISEWPNRGVLIGLLASWTALTVHHLVDKLYVNNIYIHLGVMLGLLQLFELRVTSTDNGGEGKLVG